MKRVSTSVVVVLLCAAVCVIAKGCGSSAGPRPNGDGDGNGNGEAQQGMLRVLVTDKPFPLEHIAEAFITIERVEVRRVVTDQACTGDADCDDGDACTVDSCAAGECEDVPVECVEGEACVDGVCVLSCATDAECNDGDACTVDACIDGHCTSAPMNCADGDPCTVDTCADGVCQYPDVECSAGFDCVDGDCLSICDTDDDCDDEQFCNGSEMCAESHCYPGVEPCAAGQSCDEESDGCIDDDDDDDSDDDGPFIVIFEGERTFNLLDLQNGRTDLLAEATVPAGRYTQMRLIVTGGQITLNDDENRIYTLTVPSGSQSGIKLHLTFDVVAGEETLLLLDVDLSRAFTAIPGGHIEDPETIRTFHFTPSVAMRLIELVEAGSISGTVTGEDTNPLGDVSVTAYTGVDVVASSSTNEEGTYTLAGLGTGVYRLVFLANGYENHVVDDVAVYAGEVTENVDAVMVAIPEP